jgi:hypothetical protein
MKKHYKLLKSNKDVYKGSFIDGKKHGCGKLTHSNQNVYEGNFENGKKHGFGTQIFKSSGNVYEGNFENNIIHGKGIFKFKNGQVYDGNFKDGKKHGEGTYTYKNRDKYVGNFENNIKHGNGKYIYSDDIIYDGRFINGFLDIPITQPTEKKEPYEITLFINAHGCEIECKPLPEISNINFKDYISSTEFECTNIVIPDMDIAYAIALFNSKPNPNELYRNKKRGKNTNTIREFDHNFAFGLKKVKWNNWIYMSKHSFLQQRYQ